MAVTRPPEPICHVVTVRLRVTEDQRDGPELCWKIEIHGSENFEGGLKEFVRTKLGDGVIQEQNGGLRIQLNRIMDQRGIIHPIHESSMKRVTEILGILASIGYKIVGTTSIKLKYKPYDVAQRARETTANEMTWTLQKF